MKDTRALKKLLSKSKKTMRKEYKNVLSQRTESENGNWLGDNYSLLCAAVDAMEPLLRKKTQPDFSTAFDVCRSYALERTAATEISLRDTFAPLQAELSVCEALPTLLAAAAAVNAAQHFKAQTAVFSAQIRFIFSLRKIDFRSLLPEINRAERCFYDDPAGIYPIMDEETKACYRRRLHKYAKAEGLNETDAAEKVLKRSAAQGSRHIGFELPASQRTLSPALFVAAEALLPAVSAAAAAFFVFRHAGGFFSTAAGAVFLFLLTYLPFFAALRPFSDAVSAKIYKPRFLPALSKEAPDKAFPATLLAVSAVLPPAQDSRELYTHLRELFSSNSLPRVKLCALFDYKTAKTPTLPTDEADLAAAKRVIDRLNTEYGGGFLLLLRDRVFSSTEQEFTGFERKRGAMEALVRMIKTGENGFAVAYGDTDILTTQFLLALDADTRMPFEALRGLLAVAAHPLNKAVLQNGKTVAGYGCFSPRTETAAASAAQTVFSSLFTAGGIDAYSPRVSERNMDLFGTGLFCGKGLIDVDAYYETCMDTFAHGEILSHDILEGARLRTAFVGGSVLTERFPASPAAYFKRLNRWIRGDVQNLRYVFFPYKKTPLSEKPDAVTRLRLIDNVRRAVTPVFSAVCLLLSAFAPYPVGILLFFSSLCSVCMPGLFAATSIFFREGFCAFTQRYYSRVLPAGLRTLCRTIAAFALLPCEAAVSLDAALRAFYRGFISRRKTLEWTTAAQSEKGGGLSFFTVMVSALFAAALAFGPLYAQIYAAFILLFIPFAASDGIKRKARPTPALRENDRSTLLSYTAAVWKYFETYADGTNHFLPPDNVQLTPVRRIAKRTSPTNIGLYLLCTLAAADLSLISAEAMSRMLKQTLETLRAMPKYRGLLYNWYDTGALTPLRPAFISTVDCGNYLVCLTALREGVKEYLPLGYDFRHILQLIEAELSDADLAFLYDFRRGLFSIGFDVSTQRFSDSYYDTYMSEARMTSFYAAAKRIVPASHWEKLDRRFIRSGPHAAVLSFSGTAFEYFMPTLFMPAYKNSFQWEGLKACIAAQKKRRTNLAGLYGISESGFYAFDDRLNYSYKAHGIAALSMKRDPDDEPVFSPYSTFLFLPFDPKDSMKNLARFASLGAYGENGFFEAVDFTARAGKEDYMIVRSYMAHHAGMSMLAAVNMLTGGVFIKRFCSDNAMRSALSLLEERVPTGAPVIVRTGKTGTVQRRKPERSLSDTAEIPAKAGVFSDREASLLCDAYGRILLRYAGREILGASQRSYGVFTAVQTGGALSPLAGMKPFEIHKTCCYREELFEDLHIKTAAALLKNTAALAIPIKIKNTANEDKTASLLWYFEPLFTPTDQPAEHPAFADMGVRISHDQTCGALLFTRLENKTSAPFLAAALSDETPLVFTCDRESILGYDPNRLYPFQNGLPTFDCSTQFRSPAAAVKATLTLKPGEKQERVLLLIPGASKSEVLFKLTVLRRSRLPDIRHAVRETVCTEGLPAPYAQAFLLETCFDSPSPTTKRSRNENTVPLSALWEKGISGDLPLLRVRTDQLPETICRALIRLHRTMSACGVPQDLLLFTSGPADYVNTDMTRLHALLRAEGVLACGGAGGVHVINTNTCSPRFLSAAYAAPGVSYPAEKTPEPAAQTATDIRPLVGTPLFKGENTFVPGGYFIGAKGSRPWCHTLSNAVFGTLVSAGTLGYTWAMNARQNKLTPWSNDVCSDFAGERLYLLTKNAVFDCTVGASVYFYDNRAVYGTVCRNVNVRLTVQTDRYAMKKRLTVNFDRPANEDIAFVYKIKPYVADNDRHAAFVKTECENGAAVFYNPSNTDYKGFCAVYSDAAATAQTNGSEITLKVSAAHTDGCFSFYMAFAATRRGLNAVRTLPFAEPGEKKADFHTGIPRLDDFASALLLHQAHDTRVLARTGFYQCSGAYGFRDQLQDTMNLCEFYPKRAEYQLLRCAAAQFPEGDVLHWFHAVPFPSPCLKGVRTRCSDDLLWLPLAVAVYIQTTGDVDILNKSIPFLTGEPLAKDEKERYAAFFKGAVRASLYTHCLRAIEAASATGDRGLPLIRGGDWNDAFGSVGENERGESVWLAMFLRLVCSRFSEICVLFGDVETAAQLRKTATEMEDAVLKNAFNGRYFLRGYYDDGTVLGGEESDADKIDLLVQAFASLSDTGNREQRHSALRTAYETLYDRQEGIIRLFSPPFSENTRRAGYVNDYPPGVRENGGQYTHAAVWFAEALYKEGMSDEARTVLEAVLPNKSTAEEAERFCNEPYALSADVRYGGRFSGAGGWSLYTGAAGVLAALAKRLSDRNNQES